MARPCETGQAFLSGRGCVSLKTTNACPSGQFLINNEHGNGYCDCQPGKAYHSPSKACYRVYSQGPCLPGEIYKVLDDYRSSRAQCIPNPCPRENMVKLDSKCHVNSRGTCYPLGEKGPCVTGVLAIDQVLLEPACFLESDSHTLFSRLHNQCPIGESIDESGTCRVPFRISDTRKCHRGSLRDQEGRCRGHFSPSSLEEGTSLCPNNMIMIGGACYRVSG
ncbi:hypothetical protein SK128_026933 [Halocaridina rubra]|uniref:DUF4789 domain-containing protein n=1 Tax=Halocaridina rubra TaxID=373956 RepID=A0AAN8XDV1_HALRR